jgi:hypothetical protein
MRYFASDMTKKFNYKPMIISGDKVLESKKKLQKCQIVKDM